MKAEGADAIWILDTYETKAEAMMMEQAISGRFGLPQIRFFDDNVSVVMTKEQLALAWEFIGENQNQAIDCLSYFGRDIQYPLFRKGCEYSSLKRPMVVHASNLMDGVLMLPYQNRVWKSIKNQSRTRFESWRPVTLSYKPYVGFVYSLDVDVDHLYVADGLVTHNCQAIYAWRGADNDGFSNSQIFWNIAIESLSRSAGAAARKWSSWRLAGSLGLPLLRMRPPASSLAAMKKMC
jgi:hypothetical protein